MCKGLLNRGMRGIQKIPSECFRFHAVTFATVPNLSYRSPFDNQLMKSSQSCWCYPLPQAEKTAVRTVMCEPIY